MEDSDELVDERGRGDIGEVAESELGEGGQERGLD